MDQFRRVLILLVVLVSHSIPSFGQQPEIYNQFFMNPYLYNPAYAGVEGHTVLYLLYHQQWSGLDNSPTVSHFSFHTPMKGGIGIGVSGFNFGQGLLNRSQGKVSGSYLVTLDRKHHLRFGMSLGGGSQTLNFGELDDPTDPAFIGFAGQNSYVLADFGATYHFDHFNIGFSIPNLVGYNVFEESSFGAIRVNPLDNLMFKINYRGHLSDDIAIEPHIIYRYSNIVPSQYEATAIFHIYHVVWAGMTYRQDNSIAVTFGTKVAEKLGIGIGYELGNAAITNFLGPTYEVHIGYHIGTRKAHAAHASSFIKSHRLTPEERAEKDAKEREEQLLALQESRKPEPENEDQLSIVGQATETTETEEPQKSDWIVNDSQEQITRTNEFGETEKALVIERENDQGEIEKAVVWVPEKEDWQLADASEPPLERTDADGHKEIGVKYYRTDENGQQELVVKWEPVVNEEQAKAILSNESTVQALAENPAQSESLGQNLGDDESTAETVIEDEVVNSPVEQTEFPEETITDPVISQPSETDQTSTNEPPQEQLVNTDTNQTVSSPTEDLDEPTQEIPEERGDATLTDDRRTHEELENSDVPLEVKKGNNLLELPTGNYVIAGAFSEFQHAEDFSDDLFLKGFHETIVGYVSAKGYYYTVVYRSDNLNQANTERNRIRNRPGMDKVWVLKVTD